MLTVTNLIGFGAVASADPAVITYRDKLGVNSGVTSPKTFSALALGTASADRYIVACISARSGLTQTVSSVTIGGISATLVCQTDAGDSAQYEGMFIALVPTGTTGDVVVTHSPNAGSMAVAVWSITGLQSATPTDTGVSTADPGTTNLDISAGGVSIACGFATGPATMGSTWTNITEDFDVNTFIDINKVWSGASGNFAAAQTALATSVDYTGATPSSMVFVAASFR